MTNLIKIIDFLKFDLWLKFFAVLLQSIVKSKFGEETLHLLNRS